MAMSGAASGSSIRYDFRVDATSGVLSGDTASGNFTFDSGTIPSGGGIVGGTNLLTALSFSWDGITYDASTANTGWLAFNSRGDLTFFSFGNDCISLACTINTPSTDWLVSPGAVGFVYSDGGPFGFGKVSYSLVTSVPEPATAALFGLALILGVLSLRTRDRLTSTSGSATAPERT
jgi:PEP-CTERM motif